MVKLNFLPDKYEKRVKSFSAVMTDMKIEENDNGEPVLTMEFGDDLPLTVKLGYDRWVEVEQLGQKTPKPGSPIYKLFRSIDNLGIEIDFDFDANKIETSPSLLGKECSFDCQDKSFPSKEEVDENGKPKVIKFWLWTLVKVSTQSTLETVTPAAEPKKDAVPVDMSVVRRTWLQIVSELPDEFSYPQMIQGKGKFLQGKKFSDEETMYYKTAEKVKTQFAALIDEGYVNQNGNMYNKVHEMIEAGLNPA